MTLQRHRLKDGYRRADGSVDYEAMWVDLKPYIPDHERGTDPLDEVMTLREASDVFGINFRTLHNARDDGRLRARKSGNIWLVTRAEVKALVNSDRMRVKPQ